MTSTTLSSRELHLDMARATKAALNGPVFIADEGEPSHVLLNIVDYQRLAGRKRSLLDALAMPGGEDIEFEPPKLGVGISPADFS